MKKLISAAVLASSLVLATTTGAETNEAMEIDDLTFLGLVYKLSCTGELVTTIYDNKFMGAPIVVKGLATIIDLETRTIKDSDLALAIPIKAEFKANMWKSMFDKRILVTAKWRENTVRMTVDIAGSPRGIDGIQFTKTTQRADSQSLSIEWGKCRSLPPK